MSKISKPTSMFLMGPDFDHVYTETEQAEIRKHTHCLGHVNPSEIALETIDGAEVELIFGGWGMIPFNTVFLEKFPSLKVVFYGAGSVRALVTPEFWERGIQVTTSREANAVSVCDYCVGTILLSLKGFWDGAARSRSGAVHSGIGPVAGTFRSTVGLVSLGTIGRLVVARLRDLELHVIAYDPFLNDEEAEVMGIEKVNLGELFERADVVSIHTPWLPETEQMINRELLASMKQSSTLINTSRGAVIDEPALCDVLAARPDLWAVIDVTHPEPPASDSPLRILPNVHLTPHIAGATGPERRRLGAAMVEEMRRYLAGQPLKWRVTRKMAAIMA